MDPLVDQVLLCNRTHWRSQTRTLFPAPHYQALRRAGEALGVAAANVLTTTGCEVVVVGGGLVEEMQNYMFPIIVASVREHSFAGATHAPLVKLTTLGDDAVAIGSAAYCKKMQGKGK
jgi:predicted NBD/HSP70 family sugar kinase